MATLESVFIKEFSRNIRSTQMVKDIYSIPLPKEVESWEVSGAEQLAVKGISEDAGGLYSKLNNSIVSKMPIGYTPAKRKVDLVSRSFVRDSNNKYVYEPFKIPKGSIVVISDIDLELPYGYSCNEVGFGYIDFISTGKEKKYLYCVPKKYLFLTNQTALALSVKNMKNYAGSGYVTWKSGVIFLHVIPYKPNAKYVGTKILKTGHTLDYSREVKSIVDYWINKDIIPNVSLCETVEKGNLVLKETSVGYDFYEPLEEFSLGEREIYGSSKEGE